MSPSYFPLRWESTGDQWWFASPLDWAAAKGHYDLVRELIRLDANHLIKLTSLRRIRHLETCRSQVAQKLFSSVKAREGKIPSSELGMVTGFSTLLPQLETWALPETWLKKTLY
ncbi:hypothetical protein CsSME_00004939 [Camellia sinensis var. sinensis]